MHSKETEMFTRFANSILTLALVFIAVAGTLGFSGVPAHPVAAGAPTPLPADQAADAVLFSQLMSSDIQLTGPFDSSNVVFNVPPEWQLASGAQLSLSIAVAFNAPAQGSAPSTPFTAGTLAVRYNNVVVGVISLNQVGEASYQFPIPDTALKSARDDGLSELLFTLDSGWSCTFDESMLVAIHTNSSITLPHSTIAPSTDLTRFPAPIFVDSAFLKSSALIVVPDQPSAAEMQAALTVAAGLGNLSSRSLSMDISSVGHLAQDMVAANHLILVGKASSLPYATVLNLPLPVSGDTFAQSSLAADSGVIEMVNSPWAPSKVVLVVSGNSDAGIVKAAQALSTGIVRSSTTSPNVAIVDQVRSTPLASAAATDQTLAGLGYSSRQLTRVGVNQTEYSFYVPAGQTLTSDAYFDLLFSHSALLAYDRSGIVVSLNGTPIGSSALSDKTAALAVNSVQFQIPPSVARTGINLLDVRFSLNPFYRCTNPNLSAIYANIWSDSRLHLPMAPVVNSPTTNSNLRLYPAPFAGDPTLHETAFVLQKDDPEVWRIALDIAAYLGDKANGPVMAPATFFGDAVPQDQRSNYNFVMIGQPAKLPVLGEINQQLPAPFDLGSGQAIEPQLQVKYKISPTAEAGYVELLSSPWNPDRTIVIAAGNTSKAVLWAASDLIEPQSYRLAGNFAAINDQQVITTDTRLSNASPNAPAPLQTPGVVAVQPQVNASQPAPYRPAWILPSLIALGLLIALIVAIRIYSMWARARSESKPTVLNGGHGKDQG
jgi:hypothetical protein